MLMPILESKVLFILDISVSLSITAVSLPSITFASFSTVSVSLKGFWTGGRAMAKLLGSILEGSHRITDRDSNVRVKYVVTGDNFCMHANIRPK